MNAILKKIAAVKKEIGKISKDSTNPFHNSQYFDINALLEHVEPLLEKNNLILTQPIKDGIVHSNITDLESDESIGSSLKLPDLTDPQKIGSCISYYRRYTLQSLLAIQAEDDDGNKAKPVANSNNKPQTKTNPDDDDKEWINIGTPEWENAVKKKATVKDVREHYKLSKANETQYLKEIA